MLIATDGYSIETDRYDTKEIAMETMKKAYDLLHPDDNNDERDKQSWISDDGANLYANGDSVYL